MSRTTDNLGEGNMATPRPRDENAAPASESRLPLQAAKPLTWFDGIRQFIHEVALEMKKVSWPTRTEVVNTTMIVVVALFFFAAFLFLADIVLTYAIELLEAGARQVFG
jgi:preprotein translocase subunit SecE